MQLSTFTGKQSGMKKHYLILSIFFAFAGLRLSSQCSVHFSEPAPNHNYICHGDSVVITAVGSGTGSLSVDQSQLAYNAGMSARTLAGYSEWQSFTAGVTGTLAEIDMGFFNAINGSGVLNVFAGTGTGGTLLDSRTVNVVCVSGNCLIPFTVSAPVVAGQVYTFQFMPGSGIPDPYGVQVVNPGTYAGGEMDLVDPSGTSPTGFDMVFKTWVQGNGPVTYLWSTGSSDSTITVHAGGEYYVTVTSGGSCNAVDSIQILPDSLSVSTLATATSCGLNNGSAVLHISGGLLPYSISWSNTATTDTILNLQAGSYYASVSDALGCEVHDSALISPSSAPVASITGHNDSLLATPASHYQWFHNGEALANDTSRILIAPNTGSYTVHIIDSNGCSAVSNPYILSGIDRIPDNRLVIWPNPASGGWQLRTDNNWYDADLRVFDAAGNLLYTSKVTAPEQQLNLNLASGIYWLQISTPSDSLTRKLVKL